MIRSLEDVGKWYHSVKSLAVSMKRIARLWDHDGIAEVLGRDNRLRYVTSADLSDMATTILDDLDNLAVLVMFSVFEATGRKSPTIILGVNRPNGVPQGIGP